MPTAMVARLRGYSAASSLERFLVLSSSPPVMGSMSRSGGGVMILRDVRKVELGAQFFEQVAVSSGKKMVLNSISLAKLSGSRFMPSLVERLRM